MRKLLLLLSVATFLSLIGFSQDFSNKGKDFWVGYGNHIRMLQPGNPAETMQIYLTSDVNTTGNVSISSVGFNQNFTITANQITVVNIPRSAALLNEGLYNHGIHITALKPIVAYGFIYVNAVSGATVFLPTNTLGKEYYSLNYTQVSNEANSYSYFFVTAVEPGNTIVEIKPSQITKNGWPANVTQTVTLTQGQIYQVLSTADLTGSTIKSIASGTGGCKKIAVFCGSGKISIGCASAGSSDNLYQQMYPASTWGKRYVLVPSHNKTAALPGPTVNTNFFRIYRPDNTTVVLLNGVVVPSASFINNYYQFSSNQTNLVEADKSILVAQYFSTAGCSSNSNPHDPEMIYLNPVEQTVKDVTVNSMQPAANTVITQHFINVVVRNAGTGVSSFKIDGITPPPAAFTVLPQDNNFSYARIWKNGGSITTSDPALSAGAHRLTCDSGFNAIAYGFGQAESYGYSAGTNLIDLFQQIGVQSQFGIETSPSICTNSPFRFKVSLPYCADSIKWDLSGLPGPLAPANPAIYYTSCTPGAGGPDSTTMVNGKTIYWYSLPNLYSFSTAGSYPVNISVYNTGSTLCGSVQDIEFDLGVFDPPMAGFSHTQPGCIADPVQFTDSTLTVKPNYQWSWNFGDPGSGAANTSTLQNPVHIFSTSGPHTVTLTSITTVGCFSTTASKVINVPVLVNAAISGTAAVCQNAPQPNIVIDITDGLPPYTINYALSTDGGPAVAQTPIITNTLSNIFSVPTGTVGTLTYSLTSIENANAAFCVRAITGQSATITVNPLPTATISGTTTVCQNTASPDITFTGGNASAPYTFTYTINGGPAQTVTTTTGNSVTLAAPTTAIGTFNYTLVSVSDGSSTLCQQPASGSATVTVQATSSATISGSATVCQSATAPVITFTGINGNAPFTFTYNINGGASQTISTSASSNTATLTVPMTAPGTFVYNLTGVSNTGTIVCFTPITGASATVIIKPVPTATIAGTTTVCRNSASPDITFTGANGTTPYSFTYTINGGAPLTVTTVTGNSVTVAVPTATAGTFVYALTQVRESSSTQCIRSYTNTTATVTVNPLPTATITGTTTICQAGTSPNISFTAAGGVAPYTFSYTLNGSPLTVTTTVGNSVTVPVSTTTAGTHIYNLISVQESSSVTCLQNQTGTATVTVHPKPTASFTTVGPYCSELAVTFTPAFGITPTGSIVSWVWDFGDGAGPQIRTNGNPFTVTYPTAGVKNVTFKTISDNGCVSDIFPMAVTINSKPVAGFINPEACLADANAQFYDTSSVAGSGASIVYWSWDFGDGTPIYAGSGPTYKDPIHAYSAVGQKTVTLTVTTNSGCMATTVQQFFINGEVTRAAFIPQNGGNFCSNRPVQIKENSLVNVGGLIRVDIYWDYVAAPTVFEQDDLPTPGKIYTHSYPNLQVDRTYSIRYFAYSGFNGVCQKDTIINIIVRASPVAQFLPVPDVCLNGGPVVLSQGSASGGTGVYMGPGITFAGGVYTFDPLAAGVVLGTNNSVVYTVTSPAGCDSAKVQQIKVLAPPVVNTFAPVGNICHNNLITFQNTITNGDGTVVKWIYNWNDGSPIQTMTTGANVTHVYTTPGIKTATLTLETGYGCKSAPPFPATFTVNPLPAPSYSFSYSVCLPNANVVFTNMTPNIGTNTYLWSFELPSTSVANTSTVTNNPSHIYTTQGPYSTNLVATNIATGCKDTSAIQIINSNTIHPEPVVQFTPVPDVCLNNGTVQLTQGSETSGMPGGPGIYTGPGVSASGVFDPITAGVGLHTLTYTWTSSFNCPASRTQTVSVLAPPVVNTFTTSGNRCETKSIIFQNTVTQGAGAINTWVYDWGDGTPVTTATNGNDITHTYAIPGTYPATLYVVTNGSCKSAPALRLEVVVNPLPVPNFTYSDTSCLPQAKVIFTNTTPNINDWYYKWYFVQTPLTGSDSSTAVSPSHIYSSVGPHAVTLRATSLNTGCTASITKPVTSVHPAPVASFDFNKTGVCLGGNVTVLDNSTFADGTSTSWTWNYGENLANSNGQIQSPYTYSTAGIFNVKLSIKNSFGCTDDTVRSFTVYANPTVNAGPDQFILEGGSTILQATATGNGLQYLWTASIPAANLSSTTVLQPLASPLADVTYTLKVTAQGGCVATDNVFVKLLKTPDIPNTFTPNNDGIHDFWEIKYLNTYPQNRVQVFTRSGQLVFESKGYTKPWDGNKNGKSLPLDTYYYIIEPGNGRKVFTGYVTIIK